MSIYTPLLEKNPKAKPLAWALIAAAAEQGASAEELELACKLAVEAYRKARDNSGVPLAEFQSKAQAALQRACGDVHWVERIYTQGTVQVRDRAFRPVHQGKRKKTKR